MPTESTAAECPFCRSNSLLKGPVLAESRGAYLLENIQFPGNYLIIPNSHVESPVDLADTWWQDVKELLQHISPYPTDYNLAFNIGQMAGQTVKHLHLWAIPRAAGEPASGKGLLTLINFRNEHA
ncbi:MAG TPA: HIT domain-containing protein [Candidatus Saccharimonadales bacterium]|jgi:histidine triad (HIT) family protein